jgi:hypothetical protein
MTVALGNGWQEVHEYQKCMSHGKMFVMPDAFLSALLNAEAIL